jgi:hypothetical protein
MAEHDVSLKIPNAIEVGNSDLKVIIRKDGNRFGTLTISLGTIDWRPAKAKAGKKGETRLNWTQFDQAMKDANKNR